MFSLQRCLKCVLFAPQDQPGIGGMVGRPKSVRLVPLPFLIRLAMLESHPGRPVHLAGVREDPASATQASGELEPNCACWEGSPRLHTLALAQGRAAVLCVCVWGGFLVCVNACEPYEDECARCVRTCLCWLSKCMCALFTCCVRNYILCV